MTLNTTNMKRYGEKLFRDLLADGRMSDDTCAESCERLLNRLRRYRERHPEEKRVSPKFLNNSRRWAVSDLARRRRRRRVTAALEMELAKNELDCPRPAPARPASPSSAPVTPLSASRASAGRLKISGGVSSSPACVHYECYVRVT